MNNIGFSPLERLVMSSAYDSWKKNFNKTNNWIPAKIRRDRAIAILEGNDADNLYPIEIYKEQAFLDTLKTKGNK